jgi:ubiquinone/menaquinone biosynthesis C-methylase UbiE
MAETFDRVVGVDIAPSMIEQAQRLNRFPEKCSYVVNADDDLHTFPSGSFDFVICRIVLQHLPRHLAERYLADFFRLLSNRGVLVVQIPSRRIRRRRRYFLSRLFPAVASALRRISRRAPRIPMYVIPRRDVLALIRTAGARVIHVREDGASGPEFESLVYYVTRGS